MTQKPKNDSIEGQRKGLYNYLYKGENNMKGKINNKGPTDRRGTKVFAIGLMVVMLTNFLGACKLTEKAPKYTFNPTEPAVTETTVMETTAETTSATTETPPSTEETKPSETEPTETSEEVTEPTVTETTAAKKAVTPTKTVTTSPTKTKKTTTKKSTKKTSSKKSSGSGKIKDGDDDDDDDDEKPAKKKPTNTPTPKPYTYCTCDAKINYGWDGSSNKGTHTLKSLTARRNKSGGWTLTDASADKIEAWLNKNVKDENGNPNWGGYSTKITNKRDFRYKP